jgi:hypothetical protein
VAGAAWAGPGDYSLRIKGGPSFELVDWENQGRFGGEFDYELGYGFGFNLSTYFGVSNSFRYDLIPAVRYDYLYVGPASFNLIAGLGYGYFDANAMEIRFATGMTLPLGENFDFNTDVNLFWAPVGTPGTPVTLDWLIGFGFKFR